MPWQLQNGWQLFQHLQSAQKELPVYRLTETTGPPHDRTYLVEVCIDNRPAGIGAARTKKGAEQAAAEAALEALEQSS